MINSTRDQIEEFKESILWKDIVTELEFWKDGFNHEMMGIVDDAKSTNPSSASVFLHLGDLNGRQKAVDYFLTILDVFLSILEEKKNDSQREPADGSSDSE
jgi:hypothetical protein